MLTPSRPTVPTVDVGYLFESGSYRKLGAMFWDDYWKTDPKNPVWEVLGTRCALASPQFGCLFLRYAKSSGSQVVTNGDKTRVRQHLLFPPSLSLTLEYYSLLLGQVLIDKSRHLDALVYLFFRSTRAILLTSTLCFC
jgi:hypothetical protein